MEASERFTEEQLAGERISRRAGIAQPTFTELKKALDKYGPGGILDAAIHLPEEQYDRLEEAVDAAPKAPKQRRLSKQPVR